MVFNLVRVQIDYVKVLGDANDQLVEGHWTLWISLDQISSQLAKEVESAAKSIRGEQVTASKVFKRLASDAQSDAGATAATLSMASPPVPIRKPVQVHTNWDDDSEVNE